MKKYRSYHLGYNIPLLLRAIRNVGTDGEVCIADLELDMLDLKEQLSSFDMYYKNGLMLLKHLRTSKDVPTGEYTYEVVADMEHDVEYVNKMIHDLIDEYKAVRAEFKVKTSNLELDISMFEKPQSINPKGWFRTPNTREIADAVFDGKSQSMDFELDGIDIDGLYALYDSFKDPIDEHKDGVIAHTVLLTNRKRFDDVPFIIPLTTKVYLNDNGEVTAFLLDKKGIKVRLPDNWKVFAYRPM